MPGRRYSEETLDLFGADDRGEGKPEPSVKRKPGSSTQKMARKEGKLVGATGQPSHCPYDRRKQWGLHTAWMAGWREGASG